MGWLQFETPAPRGSPLMAEARALHGGCLAIIRSYFPNMPPSSKRIAQTILDSPEQVLALTIVQVARKANVSPSTVTRFCTSLGFSGFPEFKSSLRIELLSSDNRFRGHIHIDDSVPDIIDKVFDLGVEGLRDTLVTLDLEELQRAAEAIDRARGVFCAPTSIASGAIVSLLEHKLLNLGILLTHFNNPSMATRYIAMLQEGDVVIAVSHSGSSRIVIDFIEQCHDQGTTTICVTNHLDSPLAKVSDIRLITAAGREAPLRGEPIGVRLTQAALIDALYVVLSIRKYRRAAGAQGGEGELGSS